MEEKQGLDIDGQEISLGPFKNKPPRERDNRRSSSGEAGKSKVLFIGNLNYDSTEDGVKEYFPNATAVRILTHQDTGRSKGFGFVEFSNAEDAQKAFDERKGEVDEVEDSTGVEGAVVEDSVEGEVEEDFGGAEVDSEVVEVIEEGEVVLEVVGEETEVEGAEDEAGDLYRDLAKRQLLMTVTEEEYLPSQLTTAF
ncbi:nucleolin-like [Liolophura sinensis]|uniref:nucleolin-like n=1 Tax=Liolophura sinensis TaxID=3198878 RepID=UPI003158592E